MIEGFRWHLESQKIGREEIDARVAVHAADLARKRTWGRRI